MAKATPFRNPSGETVWRVQFRIDGKGSQETFRVYDKTGKIDDSASKKAADRFAALVNRVGGKAARAQLEARGSKVSNAPLLADWFDKYLDPTSGILTGIQPGTRAGYRRIADNGFLPRLGTIPIDEITPDDIGAWITWQEQQPSRRQKGQLVAAKTVRNYHALLSNVLEAAHRRKLIVDNPARGARISEGERREGVFLTPYEFDRILQHILPHYQPLVVFLVDTGCRWGEATALTWGDINLSVLPPTARISKAWKKGVDGRPVLGPPKSRKSRRTVPIGNLALDYLPAHGRPDDLVFPGVGGGRLWYGMFNTRIWKPAVTRSGIEKSPNIHDLRHSYASWLLASGRPINEVQRRMGHENIETTVGVYGHLQPGADLETVDVMDRIMLAVPDRVLELEA